MPSPKSQTLREVRNRLALSPKPAISTTGTHFKRYWRALVGLGKSQRRPSGRGLRPARFSQPMTHFPYTEFARGFTWTGCEDNGCTGASLALRSHLHWKPGSLPSCSETLDTAPNLFSSGFLNSKMGVTFTPTPQGC